jgi:hypothetical protein
MSKWVMTYSKDNADFGKPQSFFEAKEGTYPEDFHGYALLCHGDRVQAQVAFNVQEALWEKKHEAE